MQETEVNLVRIKIESQPLEVVIECNALVMARNRGEREGP